MNEMLIKMIERVRGTHLGDVPTQLNSLYNPLNPDHIRAVAGFVLSDNGWSEDFRVSVSLEKLSEAIPEKDSPFGDFFTSITFMAACDIADAAVQWVQDRYGEQAATELETLLEDDEKAHELAERRNSDAQ